MYSLKGRKNKVVQKPEGTWCISIAETFGHGKYDKGQFSAVKLGFRLYIL